MKKKIIKWILVLLWMGLIFYFSSRNRYESTDQSRGVLSKTNIVELFKEKTGLDLESATRIIDKIIRKVAHVVEFVVLSLLICGALSEYNLDLKKILIISFIVCFIYSCSDEAANSLAAFSDNLIM